jgi:nicotinate-nucleotide adenylyltransferase
VKVAILGGSFNPPHQGHINLSLEAKRLMNFDQVWWLPTKQNPFKKIKSEDFDIKLQKCCEITQNHPDIIVKDYEKFLNSNISIDLIRKIIKLYPENDFHWLMGADSVIDFHLWEEWQEIINLTDLIIGNRDGYFKKAKKSIAYNYAKDLGKCCFLRINKLDISSTKIRNKNHANR